MEISHEYIRLRKDFGKFPNFKEFHAELIYDLRPDEEKQKIMIQRQPCTTTVSVVPTYSETTVNTAQTTYRLAVLPYFASFSPFRVHI